MDVAYAHLRTELEAGRVFLQDSNSSNMDELCAQLRGIIQSGDGTMEETRGSDRAASLAIAVRGARRAGGRSSKPSGGVNGGVITTNTPGALNPRYG